MSPKRPPPRAEPLYRASYWDRRDTSERLIEHRKRRTETPKNPVGFRDA